MIAIVLLHRFGERSRVKNPGRTQRKVTENAAEVASHRPEVESSAGFSLHFLLKCTEKRHFSIENHGKKGKTGPGALGACASEDNRDGHRDVERL